MLISFRLVVLLFYGLGIVIHKIVNLFYREKHKPIPHFRGGILSLSAVKLIEKLKSGEISSEQIVRSYIDRIKEVNPILNAVIDERFSEALEEAKAADQVISLASDKEELFRERPLLGIPFSVKESVGVKGLSQVVGSHYRRGVKTDKDGATVVSLKQAGAIPLLVSANPEYCVSWETSTLTHGRCRNPYNTRYTPGGSTGGDGALNGAGATVFGIGSDLCGSVRLPALFNGVFGQKPTGGLVSLDGHFPPSDEPGLEGIDQPLQVGPLTRFAEDLPLLTSVLAGENAAQLEDPVDIEDIKIFYMDVGLRMSNLPMNPKILKSIEKACKHFASRGNSVQKIHIKEMNDSIEIVCATLLRLKIRKLIANLHNPKLTTSLIGELGKHLTGNPIHSIQALFFQFIHNLGRFVPFFRGDKYLKRKELLISKLKGALGKNGILFYPTFHRGAFQHNSSFFHAAGSILGGIFNITELPAVQVPTGMDEDGLPIGFQVVAAPYADKNCFAVAQELEKVFGGWVPPS